MEKLSEFLDHIEHQMKSGSVKQAMEELTLALRKTWLESSAELRQYLTTECRAHSLFQLTSQDPLTRRALQRPRGYAGDAVMMDMVYYPDARGQLEKSTPIGMQIHLCMTATNPASSAVRQRRKYAAELIDRTAARKDRPSIMAVAAGHLREAELSESLRAGRIDRFVALDQDELSLDEMDRCYALLGIEPVKSSIRPFLSGRDNFGKFDLIYSIGLYDYLDNLSALKVTERLFRSLNRGGQLMIANFLPETVEVGFMELFMSWSLIYRSLDEIRQVALTVPREEIASQEIFADNANTIGYIVLTKV